MKFDIIEFKKNSDFEVSKYEVLDDMNVMFIDIKDSYIKHLRIYTGEFSKKDNCINVYCGESSKFGYWWNGELDYKRLNTFLIELEKENFLSEKYGK